MQGREDVRRAHKIIPSSACSSWPWPSSPITSARCDGIVIGTSPKCKVWVKVQNKSICVSEGASIGVWSCKPIVKPDVWPISSAIPRDTANDLERLSIARFWRDVHQWIGLTERSGITYNAWSELNPIVAMIGSFSIPKNCTTFFHSGWEMNSAKTLM